MSLWVETPTVVDTATGEALLAFADPHWSLDEADWVSEHVVHLWLRKYPGSHTPTGVLVTLDCVARTAQVDESVVPLRDVEATLDRALMWPQPPPPEAPPRLVDRIKRLFGIRGDAR